MKTLVFYSTHFGYCHDAADALKKLIPGKVDIVTYELHADPDLSQYDQVILGASIRMSLIDNGFKLWMEEHTNELLEKPLGIFLACIFEQDESSYLTKNFPPAVVEHASAVAFIGGSLEGSMKWYDRTLAKMMQKQVKKSGESIAEPHLERLEPFVASLLDTPGIDAQAAQEAGD